MRAFCTELLSLLALSVLLVSLPSNVSARGPDNGHLDGVYANAGVGAPELGHAEVGFFPLDRLSVEAQYKWSIFNHLTGIGLNGHFWRLSRADGPPRYSAFAGVSALVNPTLGEIQLSSRGDEIGAAAIAYLGFTLVSERGFMFRAAGGPMFHDDPGHLVFPTFQIGAGWMF